MPGKTCDTLPAMRKHDDDTKAIHARLESIARTLVARFAASRERNLLRAARLKEAATESEARGHEKTAEFQRAHAIELLERAAEDAFQALELCDSFGFTPPETVADCRWKAIESPIHRGVGEGDAGLDHATAGEETAPGTRGKSIQSGSGGGAPSKLETTDLTLQ